MAFAARVLSSLLLVGLLCAPPSLAQAVKGRQTVDQLYSRSLKLIDDLAGNPLEAIKDILKGYATPQAIQDLQTQKGKYDDFAGKLARLGNGKYDELAIGQLRSSYEDLHSGKKVKGLPSLVLIDKLWMVIQYAGDMVKAAEANTVATNAHVLFDAMSDDNALAGPDDPIPATEAMSRKIYVSYWIQGGHRAQMQMLLAHQFGFKLAEYEALKTDADNGRSNPSPDNLTLADDYVVERIKKIIPMANVQKKKFSAIQKANTLRREFDQTYARWKNVYPDDFAAVIRVMKKEKELERALPRYKKLLGGFSAEMSAARNDFRGEGYPNKAANFCGNYVSKLYSASEWLSMYGGKHVGLQKRASAAYSKAYEFCKTVSKKRADIRQQEEQKAREDYRRYVTANKDACSSSGIAGLKYDGPDQSTVNDQVANLDEIYGGGEVPISIRFSVKMPAYDLSKDIEAYILKNAPSDRKPQKGINAVLNELDRIKANYWRGYRQLSDEINKASGEIAKERSRQVKECDRARESAEPGETVRCFICDFSGVGAASRIARNSIPQMDNRMVQNKNDAWRKYYHQARRAVAGAGYSSGGLRIGGGDTTRVERNYQEDVDARYAKELAKLRSIKDSDYLIRALVFARDSWTRGYERDLAWLKKDKASVPARRAAAQAKFLSAEKDAAAYLRGASAAADRMRKAANLLKDTPWFKAEARRLAETASEVPGLMRGVRLGLSELKAETNAIGKDIQKRQTAIDNAGHIADFFANAIPRIEKVKAALKKHYRLKGTALGEYKLEKYYSSRDYGGGTAEVLRKVAGEIRDMQKTLSSADRQIAPGLFKLLDDMLSTVKKYKPIPKDGILYFKAGGEQAILLENVYKKMETRLLGIKTKDADLSKIVFQYVDVANKLKFLYDWDSFDHRKEYAKHPVYAAYLKAAAAVKTVEERVEAEKARRSGSIDKEYSSIVSDMNKLKKSSPARFKSAFKKLEGRAEKLLAKYYNLSGKQRDKTNSDPSGLAAKLSKLKYGLQNKAKDAAVARIAKTVEGIVSQMRSLKPSRGAPKRADALLNKAGMLVQDAGVSGDRKIRGLMQTLANLTNKLRYKSPPSDGPYDPNFNPPDAPPSGAGHFPRPPAHIKDEAAERKWYEEQMRKERAKGGARPGKGQSAKAGRRQEEREPGAAAVIRTAEADMKRLMAQMKAVPAGPAGEDAADRLLEKAQDIFEDAEEDLGKKSAEAKRARMLLDSHVKKLRAVAKEKGSVMAIAKARALKAKASISGPEAAAQRKKASADLQKIRDMYTRFAAAFSGKDLAGVLYFLSEDWEASDGVSIDEMEELLENSFSIFDTVQMRIQNLKITRLPSGQFRASYQSHIAGRIRSNDLQHEEKSSQVDTISLTPDGPKIMNTTGNTTWIQ